MRPDGRTDDEFLDNLHAGYAYQKALAHRLVDEGFAVYCPPLRVRPAYSERGDYSDGGDMFISHVGKNADGITLFDYPSRMEVRSRNLTFNGPHDFPFDTVLLDPVSRWEDGYQPDIYAVISRETEAVMFLSSETKPDWVKEWVKGRPFWAASKELFRGSVGEVL